MVRLIYNPIEVALELGDGIKGYILLLKTCLSLCSPATAHSRQRPPYKAKRLSGVRHDATMLGTQHSLKNVDSVFYREAIGLMVAAAVRIAPCYRPLRPNS